MKHQTDNSHGIRSILFRPVVAVVTVILFMVFVFMTAGRTADASTDVAGLLRIVGISVASLETIPAESQDVPEDPEAMREREAALADLQEPGGERLQGPNLMRGEGASNPLFAAVDNVNSNPPAALIDVINNTSVPAFTGFAAWGAAYDAANNKVYFNNGGILHEYFPSTGTVNVLGQMTYNGSNVNFVGLAFHNGVLYGVRNIATEGLYTINTTTRDATLLFAYAMSFDLGGLDADPVTGIIYATNDATAAPTGRGARRWASSISSGG